MTSSSVKLSVVLSLALAAAFLCALPAAAQQITYYTFDTAPGNYTYGCYDPAVDPVDAAAFNQLLCLNDATELTFGTGSNPSFDSVSYPANLGAGTHTEMLMNAAAGGHSETAWFSVPQKITNGFTSYFAFRLGSGSFPPADGIAFVVQNAQGNGAADPDSTCKEASSAALGAPLDPSSGPNVMTGGGGCMGYSGIDNSLAVEFDTYQNSYDSNANHIAIQSCGTGVNSSSHYGTHPCLVHDDVTTFPAINTSPGVTLSDGAVHEVVVEYTGASGTPANQLQVFIDPPFVTGTHTPCSAISVSTGCTSVATAAITVIYNIGSHLLLLGGDSAYVGFTAATGSAYESQEILSWTFTPHTTAEQEQPIAPPTQQTTFPFGDHTYGVTFPADSSSTSNIDMVTTAITIDPLYFQSLIVGTPFEGSQCQVYDGTGGNCVVYSISCVQHPSDPSATPVVVPCPPIPPPDPNDPSTFITLKSAYENTVQPVSPGMMQGDPFLAPISQIVSNNDGTATATCAGECAVDETVTPTVKILANSEYNGVSVTVVSHTIDTFTFNSSDTNTGTGGYVNSTNLQNIFVSYNPQRIDGTSTGKTKNFSEVVALSLTSQAPGILSPNNYTFTVGIPGSFTVQTSGVPTASLVQGGMTLPNNITFTDNHDGTGTLAGTAASATDAASPYNITFTAHNTAGADAVQAFTLTVLPKVLQSIAVTPASPSVAAGLTQQFTATGTYSDATTADLTSVVTWGSTNHNAATISSSGVTAGLATTIANGTTTISATLGSVSDSTVLTVTSATLQSIVVAPATASIFVGQNQPYTATGHYSDGSTSALTSGVNWASSTSAATILNTGIASGASPGPTYITASVGNVTSNQATLNVNPVVLQSIAVTPTLASIVAGTTQPFSATGTYSDGSMQTPPAGVTWASSNMSVATVSPTGVASGLNAGGTNITAYVGSIVSNAGALTVTSASILSVSPANLPFGTVLLGSRTDLTVTLKNIGTASLTISKISFTYGPGSGKDYGYTTQCGGALKAGKTCTIKVELYAQDLGAGSALLNIYSNQPGSPSVVSLSGTVINPKVKVSVSSLSFGTVKVGQSAVKTVTVTSTGDTPLMMGAITITGSSDFTLNPPSACPPSMAKNVSCTFSVQFAPSARQSRSGTLKISDNASSSPQTVSLSGKGN